MITYPKITTNENNKSEFDKKISYSGLPFEVKFCKKCVISNQRPTSAIEYKHTPNSIKETISFNEDGICDACYVRELKEKKIDWENVEDIDGYKSRVFIIMADGTEHILDSKYEANSKEPDLIQLFNDVDDIIWEYVY